MIFIAFIQLQLKFQYLQANCLDREKRQLGRSILPLPLSQDAKARSRKYRYFSPDSKCRSRLNRW